MMRQDALVNGQVVNGDFNIGKLSSTTDVPVEFYKYTPDEIESDPGYTIVIDPQDMSEEELRIRKLSDIQEDIVQNGLNYETIVTLESIVPGIFLSNMPIDGFTNELSNQSLSIALERIDVAKVTGVLALITAIIGLIVKLISLVTGDNKNVTPLDSKKVERAKENEVKVSQKVTPNIKKVSDKAKRSKEITQWLLDNKIGDIIIKHKRLVPSLNIDETTADPNKYFNELLSNKDNFDLNGILSNNMPNIFYMNTSDLKKALDNYVNLYNGIKKALDSRVDNLNKLMKYFYELRVNPGATFVLDNKELLSLLNAFNGKHFDDENSALAEFSRIIKSHWDLPENAKPNPQMVANVISNDFIKHFNVIINGAENIKSVADRNQNISKDVDVKRQLKSVADASNYVNEQLANANISEDHRTRLLLSKQQLDAAPKKVEDEYRQLRSIIVSLIRPSLNAGRSMKRLKSNVTAYIHLTDDLTHLFEKFEKQFGDS